MKPKPPSGRRYGRILAWIGALLISVCVAAAIAVWSVRSSEQRFHARLQTLPVAELEKLSLDRNWDPMVFYWLGAAYTSQGDHRAAVNALKRSVGLNPGSTSARAALGLALARNDQPREAEEMLLSALQLDGRNHFAHFSLANLYGRHKRWEQAARHLKAVMDLNPSHREAQYLMAVCYGELFQEDRKMEVLERLVKQAPDDVRVLKSLGYVYIFFGKFAEAEAAYRRIMDIAPDDLEARYLYGRALAEQANTPEKFAAAEKELASVAAKVPANPGVHLALGILHFRRNEPAKAVPEFERAVKLGITEHKTWLYLGQAYIRVGRQADGRKMLDEFQYQAGLSRTVSQMENRLLNAKDDSPERIRENRQARLRLAKLYLQSGNHQRARNHIRLLLERNPRDAEALAFARRTESSISTAGRRARPADSMPRQ